MKFNGKPIKKGTVDYAVVTRDNDEIVIEIKTVEDYSAFNELCPLPEAPIVKPVGKPVFKDVEDKEYKAEIMKYAYKKLCWGFMKSIEGSEGVEFTDVDPSDSSTWENVFTEMSDAFTEAEIDYIIGKFNDVQGLTDEKIKEATESFLASQVKGQEG